MRSRRWTNTGVLKGGLSFTNSTVFLKVFLRKESILGLMGPYAFAIWTGVFAFLRLNSGVVGRLIRLILFRVDRTGGFSCSGAGDEGEYPESSSESAHGDKNTLHADIVKLLLRTKKSIEVFCGNNQKCLKMWLIHKVLVSCSFGVTGCALQTFLWPSSLLGFSLSFSDAALPASPVMASFSEAEVQGEVVERAYGMCRAAPA